MLFLVGCMPLFGVRSPLPLSPRAVTQLLLPLDHSPLRLTVKAAPPDSLKRSRLAETKRPRKDVARKQAGIQPSCQQQAIEAKAALLDCHHSTLPSFNAQPNAGDNRRAKTFEGERPPIGASGSSPC